MKKGKVTTLQVDRITHKRIKILSVIKEMTLVQVLNYLLDVYEGKLEADDKRWDTDPVTGLEYSVETDEDGQEYTMVDGLKQYKMDL